QVTLWEISGPLDCRSCATQDEIFPRVVAGEARTSAFPVSKKERWYFSNNPVAPLELPILIPIFSSLFQPSCPANFLEAYTAKSTVSSTFFNSSSCPKL